MKTTSAILSFLAVILSGVHVAFADCSPGAPWNSSNGQTCDRWLGYNGGTICCQTIPVYVHGIPEEWDGQGSAARFENALNKALRAITLSSGSSIFFEVTHDLNWYGCYIPIEGYHIDISADTDGGGDTGSDVLGECVVEPPLSTGQIYKAVITIHLGMDIFNDGVDEDDALETNLMHELGHAIGMAHNEADNKVMRSILDMDLLNIVLAEERFATDEKAAIKTVYEQTSKLACLPMPAFLSSITISPSDSIGGHTTLELSTEYENNMSSLWIGYSAAPDPSDSDFVFLDELTLTNNVNGSSYSVDHPIPFPGYGKYLIKFIDSQGWVESSLVVGGGSDKYVGSNSNDVTGLRAENFGHIAGKYWRDIATSLRSVPTIDESPVDSGEYLIIAYKDFVPDIAPICDYWESNEGVKVTLVSVDGAINSATQIKNYISAANQSGILEMIWLIGAPAVGWTQTGWESVCFVPTDHDYLDYYYADQGDYGPMEFAVGRLPAISTDEIVFYVNKELHYHWETFWRGRKDPLIFSHQLVVSVPDNGGSPDPSSWDDNSWLTITNAENSLEAVRSYSGLDPAGVDYLDVTQLAGFYDGVVLAQDAIGKELGQYLLAGEHVVHGYSAHNSSSSQFGVISSVDWLSYTTLNDGSHVNWRPCQTFWIHPSCYSASVYSHTLYRNTSTLAESARISICSQELFQAPGLLIFGPMGLSWSTTVNSVGPEITRKMYEDDSRYSRPKSVGIAWKETYNNILSSALVYPEGLELYGILGDPMLFVRRVYESTSGIGPDSWNHLNCAASPTPFNGRIVFDLSGVRPGGARLLIYDIKGRRIREITIDEKSIGNVRVLWDGCDNAGHIAASGVYFIKIENSGQIFTRKIAFVK